MGKKKPGLNADIPVSILQVPAGEEGGHGGFTKLLKEEEKEEDDGEKKEEDDEEEEMEVKRKDEEEMQNSLGVDEGIMVNFPLVPLPLVSLPCNSCFRVISDKKKLNNHIVEMNGYPISCIRCKNIFLKEERLCPA